MGLAFLELLQQKSSSAVQLHEFYMGAFHPMESIYMPIGIGKIVEILPVRLISNGMRLLPSRMN
jgi:hypothetical protein